MGWLDKSFELPGVSSAVSTITKSIGNSVSFMVADATTKISETAKSAMSVFGEEGGPLSKLGANMPSFDQMKASLMRAGSILVNGTESIVGAQAANAMADKTQGSASLIKSSLGVNTQSVDHIVTLTEIGGTARDFVRFDVMPDISENRAVQYEAVAPVQAPGAFQKYKGTDSVTWVLNCMLIARNSREATTNLEYLNRLRGWTMPFFGENTKAVYPGKLGAPPPVLELRGLRKHIIGPVPVVITGLTWTWPKDVDYLPTTVLGDDGNPVPFPAVLNNITINLVECFSTSQFNKFSLGDYRVGNMSAAFNRLESYMGEEGE